MDNNNNILEQLKNLKVGETLFVKINSDLSNTVKYYDIKFTSYDNLFMSYMNNTSENANKFNLDEFMDRYVSSRIEVNTAVHDTMKLALGDEGYEYLLKNRFGYRIDYNLDLLIINKIPNNIQQTMRQNNQCTCNDECKRGDK